MELPHSAGCLVCGRENPHGLHLDLHVDPASGVVRVSFTPCPEHIGFEGVVHGGIIATVVDEAMAWAAIWSGKRFYLCGEMTVRFRVPATIGRPIDVEAKVESARPRLVQAVAEVRATDDGSILATATGKYVPIPSDRSRSFIATLIDEPATREAAQMLREAMAAN